MRAIIREILARRMPEPPEEFVAIQVSRLNEALLVAFSAMSPTNLKAVDQVVKIVREFDRYGGAFAAEWRRPEASGLDAASDEDAAFASAWLYGGEPALQDFEAASPDRAGRDRPGNPAQSFEKVDSAPGNGRAPEAGADAGAAAAGRPARETETRGRVGKGRSQIPTQGFKKIESAPEFAPAAEDPACDSAAPETPRGFAPVDPEGDRSPIDAPILASGAPLAFAFVRAVEALGLDSLAPGASTPADIIDSLLADVAERDDPEAIAGQRIGPRPRRGGQLARSRRGGRKTSCGRREAPKTERTRCSRAI